MKMFSNLDILNLPFTVKLKTCDLKIPTLSFSATASVPDCLDAHVMWHLLLCLKHPSSFFFFLQFWFFLWFRSNPCVCAFTASISLAGLPKLLDVISLTKEMKNTHSTSNREHSG